MTLKLRILRSLTRLFIILVSLTRLLFSEKMLISNRWISGLMPNLIKKSWTVSTLGTWYKLLISGDVLAVEKLLGQIQPWLGPLDIEVQRKCYAVVFIIDFQHIRDFNTCKKNHIYTSYVGKLLHIWNFLQSTKKNSCHDKY